MIFMYITVKTSYLTSLLFNNANSTEDAKIINEMFILGSFNDTVGPGNRPWRPIGL
jgi:hypothetical protein